MYKVRFYLNPNNGFHWLQKLGAFFGFVILDLIAAGFFTLCTLYIGLVGKYSGTELLDTVFWDWENPYFLLVHTTFIPTLLYLGFIVLTAYLSLFGWIYNFVKKKFAGNPLSHNLTLFGFLTSLNIGLYVFAFIPLWCLIFQKTKSQALSTYIALVQPTLEKIKPLLPFFN